MAKKQLSNKRRRFINAYMGEAASNATEAARIAGYKQPHSQGPRLLEKVEVKKEIERLQKKSTSKAIMTREQRQERLTEMAASESVFCSGCEKPIVCAECKTEFLLTFRKGDAIKAIDILNKMDGGYVTKIETVNKSIIVEIDVSTLNDAELKTMDKLLAKLEAFNK